VNINQVPNVRVLPLGTDNFGRDMLTELVSATGTSLKIGFVAGIIATLIGLTLGLLAGYIGGWWMTSSCSSPTSSPSSPALCC
jgi:ABC-type dipeptide/oligopeptide/nickel transport system permease subunit